jgi:hypothetical protein
MRLCWPCVITQMYLAPANVHEYEVVWDVMAGTSWLPTVQGALRKVGVLLQAPLHKANSQRAPGRLGH